MYRNWLFAAVGFILVGCGESEVPFPTYKGEPNADDAALQGELLIEHGRCLYVLTSGGTRFLVALPAVATAWRSAKATLKLSGVELLPGQVTVFGGSELVRPVDSVDWDTPPRRECDVSHVWMAGDAAHPPR